MKHTSRNAWIQLAILVALGGAVILTLILPQLSDRRAADPPLELSVVVRESDSSLWSNARLGMEQAAGELLAELRFLVLTTSNDGQEQMDLLRRECERGADALVVVPAAPEELSQNLRDLTGQCPVICLESQVEGTALTVAPDNRALGQALARALLEDWTGGAVLLLNTAPESEGVLARLDAAKEVLEQAGVPVQCRLERAEGMMAVLDGLVRESETGWIMAFEPAATQGAARAKEEQDLKQPLYGVSVTTDVAAWLERGTVTAAAAWSDYAAGYLAVESAVRTARKERVEMEPLPFSVVRGEDIYDPDNQKLLFPVAP